MTYPSLPSVRLVATLAVAGTCLSACSIRGPLAPPLGQQVDDLLLDTSTAFNSGTTDPADRIGEPADDETIKQASIEAPETVSPRPEELQYDPAREAEDLAEKLTSYAEQYAEQDTADTTAIGFVDALRLAQSSSREFRTAEESYILAAIRLLIERHLWSPRFFNDTSVSLGADGVDGTFDHAVSVINTLRVTQRLPYGGNVEAAWVARATDQLRSSVSDSFVSSSSLILSGDMPLLRGAGRVAREDLIQAERDLIYAARSFERFRRELLVAISRDYFNLLITRQRIGNQIRDLEAQERRNEETIEKVRAGRLEPFERDITANAVRQSEATLANLRESYILQLERFKIRLGLDPSLPIQIADLEFDLEAPGMTPSVAAQNALLYRLDLQNERDRVMDAERSVANARNNILPDLDLDGSVEIPSGGSNSGTGDNTQGLNLDGDELDYSIGVTLSLPLDRRIEKLNFRSSLIGRDRTRRDYEEARDEVVVEARQSVREVDLARFQLELAEEQILINERGLEALELRDDADPQAILDRQNALLDARNNRDQARTDLRNSILEFLLATGQLRVTDQGVFQELPGMNVVSPAETEVPRDRVEKAIDDGIEDADPVTEPVAVPEDVVPGAAVPEQAGDDDDDPADS